MLDPRKLTEKPLAEDLDRSPFYCGVKPLDDYFTGDQIADDRRSGFTSPYVIFDADGSLVAYYTLSASQVIRDELSGQLQRKMKYKPVPAILIGRLAIQKTLQGQKPSIGGIILMRALIKAYILSQEIGSRVVVVDTIDDHARSFYKRYGFQKLSNDREQYFFDLRRVPEAAQRAGLLVK